MSNGIYDILSKLNGLQPKDNPVSMSAEPVYESVDPQDITPAVDSLEQKYQNFLAEETAKKSQSQKDADLTRGEPEIVKLVHKARLERPTAASDAEALAYQMVKANKELQKANAANDEQEKKITDLDAKVSALSTAEPAPAVVPTTQPTAVAPAAPTAAPAAKPSATILRMPAPAAEPQPAQVPVPATQAEPAVTKPARTYKSTTGKKPTVGTPVSGEQPKIDPAQAVVEPELEKEKLAKQGAEVIDIKTSKKYVDPAFTLEPTGTDESVIKGKNMLRENIEMLTEYAEGTPQLALINWNTLIDAWKKRQPKVDLDFGGRHLTIWKDQMYAILSEFATDQNAERRMQRVEDVLASYDTTVQFMMLPRVKKFINQYPQFEKNDPVLKAAKAKQKELAKQGQYDMFSGSSKLPPGSRQEMQENLGNDTMQENIKTNSILEGVRQVEDKKLKEAAKPDFLDLDKDGDTDEPMKSAAKSAKDHEPAEVDSDAVAKRKRLQALKDKQEDERAEKDDYDSKSSTRVVKGRAYGGAAQKDDEEKDLDESGLQAYLGKKKYGKEGMKALQQAGREGASKEKMAMLRAKHDKMDEARPSRADKVTKDLTSIADKKGYKSAKDFTRQDWDKVAKPHGYTGKEIAAVRGHKVEEVAPPGAKAERMVKHIKKGYAKDGKLSKREKGIAYATAWKAHNKGQVEEGTNFGDTIKNSEGKMTKVKVTEGKDAIRNHPIYTTKEAWDHYSQELAEQEMMEQSMMEAPVVDVQQELDEIAKLAGLAPKMEAKSVCPSCNCEKCECNENLDPMVPADSASPLTHTEEGMGCSMEELKEAMSRKDYRSMADKIKNMDNREDAEKICRTFSAMAKADNPRFKEDMFFTACGLDIEECGMSPATVLVGEEAMDEGNEFTKARLDAIAQGKDTFSVGGKTYNVSGDTSDEKTQVESVNEDINVNITANGEQDALNLLRKLSGMAEVPQVTGVAIPMGEEAVEEERDIELANTPHEKTAPITAVTTDAGGGLGGVKKQYPLAANRGANPIEEAKEESLWKAYESMINDVKA